MFDDIGPTDGDNDENEQEDFEPDTATIAFLDQQQAEFVNMEEEFEATYGFKHECHCGEDYAAGRVGEITQCYHNMMQESLATCARLNAELKEMTGIAQALFAELRERVEAAEGSSGEVQDEPTESTEPSLHVIEGGRSESDTDSAADDAAGEGLGSARVETGTDSSPEAQPVNPSVNKAANADQPEDPGSPEDRKLI